MGYTGYKGYDGGGPGNPVAAQMEGVTTSEPSGPVLSPQQVQMQNSMDPSLQALYNLYQSAVGGPATAMANQQVGNIQDQMSLIMAGGDLQTQLAQQNADYSLQGLGLQGQGQDISREALGRQLGLINAQHGLAGQGFDLQEQESKYGAGVSRRGLDSAATARGSFTSQGTNEHRGDIDQQLQFALSNIGLQRQGENLSYQERLAQNADSQKQLSLSAGQLGINEAEVKSRLQNALNQIGIGSQMSVDQLLSEMYKVQQGEISPISGLFGDIYALSGVMMPGSTASSGTIGNSQTHS